MTKTTQEILLADALAAGETLAAASPESWDAANRALRAATDRLFAYEQGTATEPTPEPEPTNESKINMAGWDALTTGERAQRIIEGLSQEAETLKAERDAARKALADIRSAALTSGASPTISIFKILRITDGEIFDRLG